MAFGLLLAAYFFFFTWEGIRAPFAADDMMNLSAHWRHWKQLFYAPFLLWRDFYRPMGGWFYVPLFRLFGLHPAPYHAALLLLLLGLVALTYRLARALGAAPLEAWLAAWIAAYHAGLANLYYETSHIYDVLCAIFYASALIVWARARSEGRMLRPGEAAAFLLLELGALNSKEMAVTLPVMLLVYECLWRQPAAPVPPDRSNFARWLRGPGWLIAASGLLTALAIYGRVLRGLAHEGGYAATYSLDRWAAFQRQQFRDIFLQSNDPGWAVLAAVWLLITYLAWRSPRPVLRFCWVFLIIGPLPVEFLEGRGMAVLAVPFLSWAILAGILAHGLMRAIADAIANDPGLRRLHPRTRLACVVAVFLLAWGAWNWGIYVRDARPSMSNTGRPTAAVIRQFELLAPRTRPHTTVVFLNDPFDGWDMAFIAELWFRDPTVTVRLQKKTPLSPDELARADAVFDWQSGKLVKVR
ncbi:MAG TPA: hypothetical protein VKX45_21340 [Bryobacteraceae bacterium]|nr:hypothetical protein [Bryobacteraceae bacterium]